MAIGVTAVAGTWAWRARAFCCDADRSFAAALSVKGVREAFLSVKESPLLKPRD